MMAGLIIAAQLCTVAASDDTASIAALCADHPDRIQRLFDALDLDRAGLESVKAAVTAGDWPAACSALVDYYRTGLTASWLRADPPQPGTDRDPAADAILDGIFTLYTVPAKVPLRPDGGLDWAYNGPDGDLEWGWGLNRHYWASTLLRAYEKTGNTAYIEGLDRLMSDWVASNPYPAEKNRTPQWRGLETFSRIGMVWPRVFYALQAVPELTAATRLLMLSSIPDHAHYARNFHAKGGNWITMELNGLAAAAACWPEFKEADAWFDYASNRMLPEIEQQVYPDGAQKELTSHYHRVALFNFARFIELSERAGREAQVPPEFRAGVERMYRYLAYTMRPSGYGPLNNDSNLDHTRPEIRAAADEFERKDWKYIATNGAEGTAPDGLPSVVFPWAGQVIMRNGWGADSHWAFFDAGPLGTGHWHYDKLHLSISAFGRDLLVDAGRYTYQRGPWRSYFVGTSSHNVVMVDGKGQQEYPREATVPMTGNFALEPGYDLVRATYTDGYADLDGAATHTRTVVYIRNQYWVVLDHVDTDRPRTLTALWHFHPDCHVWLEGLSAASTDLDKGNIRIVPAGDLEWHASIVAGQTEPEIQGWYSRIYNEKQPGPCAVYTAAVDGPATFAWVLLPANGPVPTPESPTLAPAPDGATQLRMTLAGRTQTLTIPAQGTTLVRSGAGYPPQ